MRNSLLILNKKKIKFFPETLNKIIKLLKKKFKKAFLETQEVFRKKLSIFRV
jgi:hypothetical protein